MLSGTRAQAAGAGEVVGPMVFLRYAGAARLMGCTVQCSLPSLTRSVLRNAASTAFRSRGRGGGA